MKKLIIIFTAIFLLSISGSALSQNNQHYSYSIVTIYESYIGKQIFIETTEGPYIYQGKCLAISDTIITIRYLLSGVKILTIPMHQIRKFYIMERENENSNNNK